MLFKTFALAAAVMLLPSVLPSTLNITSYCDAPEMTAEQRNTLRYVAGQAAKMQQLRVRAPVDALKVKVYVHVVASGRSWDEGWVTQNQINLQIVTLNQDFSKSGISFTLQQADYTINPTWAQAQNELDMKKALRKGTYQDLNLYYIKNFQTNVSGLCYYPMANIARSSNQWFLDGCTMRHDVIAGSPWREYNMGRTTVHEVGHWLGLQHTFQGGCSEPNDGFADTPAEADPAFGCPTGRNSCPGRAGLDPIGNHMDYTWDRCKTDGFSPMQMVSMGITWRNIRKDK